MNGKLAIAIAVATLAAGGYANAADMTGVCPSGDITIVRLSTISPTGTMAGFKKAAADHAKWYADHGITDEGIIMAPVLIRDPSGDFSVAKDQVMTFHIHAHGLSPDKHDAAWNAYVAEYKANSIITSETVACIPK